MKTVLRLGPQDHDRPMSLEDYLHASFREGYRYELINGRLQVSPAPDLPTDSLEVWISDLLREYRRIHPEVINYVTNKARVFLPDDEGTAPEPDVAAYQDFPLDQPLQSLRWQDVSPVLVVEVLSAEDPGKDLVRNVELYLRVPTIREYWIIDGREDADRPRLLVHRRRGQRWQKVIEVGPGQTYSTRLLPGFSLLIDPRR